MNLFILHINYEKPFEEVEKVLAEHRAFLSEYYENGALLASGPKNPRTGGVVIGKFASANEALEFTKLDPFVKTKTAKYDITEFTPVKHSDALSAFLQA